MSMKEKWEQLPAERRRVLTTLLFGSLVLLFAYAIVKGPGKVEVEKKEQGVESNMLTGAPAKELGYDGLVNRQIDTEKQVKKLTNMLDMFASKLKDTEKQAELKIGQLTAELEEYQSQSQSEIEEALEQQSAALSDIQKEALRMGRNLSAKVSANSARQRIIPKDQVVALFDHELDSSTSRKKDDAYQTEGKVYGEEAPSEIDAEEEAKEQSVFLPAGSIIRGLMLNGVDAPTSGKTKQDPMPVLVRVKHEAFLPNRFKMDVKECHAILGAFGDLSTERAFMRGEVFTCIREDGGIIEVSLDTYAVGEDGKVGVRGRLVSRSGSLIAKAMTAGFLSQLSETFRPTAVNTLNTSPNSDTLFQAPNIGEATNAAAFAGSADAMERLADYFIDMAEEIFPVIEVDVGRKIELVVKKGTWLRIKEL